jgi:hypothetical protein
LLYLTYTPLGFSDPAAATASENERLEVFRQVRDGLHQEAFAYLEQAEASESERGSEEDLLFKV